MRPAARTEPARSSLSPGGRHVTAPDYPIFVAVAGDARMSGGTGLQLNPNSGAAEGRGKRARRR